MTADCPRCVDLEERIRWLESALGRGFTAPASWRLSGSECRIFGVLISRDICTRDAAMAALYSDRTGDEPEQKIIDVLVLRLRRKLRSLGIEIQTAWGRGYFLSADTKARVRSLIAGEVTP